MNAVELHNVNKRYGSFRLKDISVQIPEGCILGIAGENGAGKSTLLEIMLGLADALLRDAKVLYAVDAVKRIHVIDPAPVLYAIAVSPVLSELKDFNDGWHWYEQMAWPARQRAMCRYIKAVCYSLAAGLIVLLLSHEFLSAMSAFLIVMAMISVCIPAVLFRRSSKTIVTGVSAAGCLLGLPQVFELSKRVRILEISHTFGALEVPEFPGTMLLTFLKSSD